MAERRMFSKQIIDSDAFLDMSASAQSLYFHLGMRADDDGFVNNPKKILRMVGAAEDDLKILVAKRFVIVFKSGVIVIKHWRMHNYIAKDRYKPTVYQEEYKMLDVKENKAYTEKSGLVPIPSTTCIQPVNNMDTQVRLGKDSVVKDSKSTAGKPPCFQKPTLEEVRAYCRERGNQVDAQRWYDYYSSNGWKVGKNPMKDWKAAVRTWEKNGYSTPGRPSKEVGAHRYDQRTYTESQLDTGVNDLVAEALRARNG